LKKLDKYLPIIKRKIPGYRFSWEIFTDIILENVARKPYWLDIGAGPNYLISEQAGSALAVGLDLEKPSKLELKCDEHYCLASAEQLSFKDDSFDFITSRYTFEHLPNPQIALHEIERVLKPGGIAAIQTTNVRNPLLMISRLIPFTIKKRIFKTLFKEIPSGTFKTFYRINKPGSFPENSGMLELRRLIFAEDMICQNGLTFAVSFSLLRLIEAFHLDRLKGNMIAIYAKISESQGVRKKTVGNEFPTAPII